MRARGNGNVPKAVEMVVLRPFHRPTTSVDLGSTREPNA